MPDDHGYWRGLDELEDGAEIPDAGREFPAGAAELSDGISRRSFVKLLGASIALAGLGACVREPSERILPYIDRPPELTPGVAQHYATSMVLGGYATGLLVESHVGRPTKIEGNPAHPASLGAAGVYEQASVLQLYDPHRARAVRAGRTAASWDAFVAAFAPGALQKVAGSSGDGLHLLLEPTASPLLASLLARLRARWPAAHVHFHSALSRAGVHAGMRLASGRALEPQYDFARADVVLALDANFLAEGPFQLRHARDFADRRRIHRATDSMNRLYVAEATLTPTGSLADHRLRVRASQVGAAAAAILSRVAAHASAGQGGGAAGAGAAAERLSRQAGAGDLDGRWLDAVAADLASARGRSIVIAGEGQPAAVHALAHALNALLGNVGHTVWYIAPPLLEAGEASHGLVPLVDALHSGSVGALVVLGGNPAYASPAELGLSALIRGVRQSAYLGLFTDETAAASQWFVPAAHYLESWGDARAYDGTASIVQPLIDPMYGGKTEVQLLALLAEGTDPGAYALVREQWGATGQGSAPDERWDRALQLGFFDGSTAPRVDAPVLWPAIAALQLTPAPASGMLEVALRPSPAVYDGRFADNAWLQELPSPMTKLTWGNAALLSPATAASLKVESGDIISVRAEGRQAELPALILPGHADGALTIDLGYGRGGAERVARGVGASGFALMPANGVGVGIPATLERTGRTRQLAITQSHWSMEGRPIVLEATLEAYRRDPDFTRPQRGRSLTLYEPTVDTSIDQWAMTIDLATCTGCSACVVACQAENNIPVVGEEGVRNSREMHWLRIDRYFTGPPEEPAVVVQPMLCQHCEKAPCEYVCPVNATVHSPDGLNEMIYNRCVGTRFCSNNCPYKVRRFNWFDYNGEIAETEKMVKNPDVTVRGRGVMEKCTMCVQRIRRAEIDARIAGEPTHTQQPMTACQQACPTRAIVFGSLEDPDSDLVRRMAEQRRYQVLHELGTQPRVQYLARISNPNPSLAGG